MTTLRQIAQDPGKALKELEIQLGANPGDLLKDMERLSPPGEDWSKHLPYRRAVSYYEDDQARTSYQPHVDGCEYCKTLLETLHPTTLEAAEFASKAKRMHTTTRRGWGAEAAPFALAAGVVMCVVGGGTFLHSKSLETEVEQRWARTAPIANPAATLPAVRGWASDVRIGSGVDLKMAVADNGAEPNFSAGQPVYLVTEIQDAPNHTPISVIWVGPDNKEVRKETNWTQEGEQSVAFSVPDTAAWKTGEYRAELWVADKKVQQAQFGIKSIEQTKQND